MGKTINPSKRIYVNKIENRVKFKIKTGYYLQLLTPETMELVGSTKSKLKKNENDENVPHSEITKLVSIHWNIVNNYQQNSSAMYTFVPNKSFGQLLDISSKNFKFQKLLTQNFHIMKYGSLIKTLNHQRQNRR